MLSCSASGILAICCDLTRPTIPRLARTYQSTRTRRRREQYMPLVAFCLRHFLADFIICMCECDFRQAQPSGKQHAILDLVRDRVVVVPPRLFAGGARGPGEMQLLALGRRSLLGDPERVMVEQAERLDHVGHRDAPVPDDHEILAVLEIGGRGGILRTAVDNRRPLVVRAHPSTMIPSPPPA